MAQGDFKLQSLFANNTVTQCRTTIGGRTMSSIGQYRAVSTTGYASTISASGSCSYSSGGVTCTGQGTCTATSRGSNGSCTSASICCVSAWSTGARTCGLDCAIRSMGENWADTNSQCVSWMNVTTDPNDDTKCCGTRRGRYGSCCPGDPTPGGGSSSTTNYSLTVHHYIDGTTNNPPGCSDPAVQSKAAGSTYTTSACSPTGGYNLKSNPTNAEGYMYSDVTVTYYYVPSYTVTVHHYVTGTSNKVYDDEITSYPQGATYSTSSHPTNTLYNNYKNVYVWDGSVPAGSTGTVTGNITVTYYYTDFCPATVPEPKVMFEGVGRYAFATAGNNNANRGTSYEAMDYSWIVSEPTTAQIPNWNTTKANLTSAGITYDNISGSYLNNTGKILKAFLSVWVTTNNNYTYNGRILIIKPDGTYSIINVDMPTTSVTLDITSEIENQSKGWYFVAYLDADLWPQTAWGITAIHEDSSLTYSYIKLIKRDVGLTSGSEDIVVFNADYELKSNFQFVGTIMGGGGNGWALGAPYYDRAWAILKDNSEYQLYDRGDGHFTGRTNVDFANATFNTQRSHNIAGGELDMFDETLSTSYFGGKTPVGVKFKKDGSNAIGISLVGLRQDVLSPNLTIGTRITPRTQFAPTTEMTIQTTVLNSVASDGLCHLSYDNIIKSSVHQDLGTPTNITLTYDGQTYTATYDSASRKVIGSNIIYMECGKPAILTYNATVKDSINNHVQDGKFKLNTTATNDYALLRCDPNKTTITANDAVETPALAKLTVNHYVIETNGMLNDTVSVCPTYEHEAANAPFIGQSYTASICSSIPTGYYFDGNYTITKGSGTYNASARQVTGTHSVLRQDGGTVVNFYYKRQAATVIIHHCKVGFNCSNSSTSGQLHADDIYTDYNYGDTYPMPKHALPSYYEPNELSDSRYEWNRQLPSNYQGRITVSPLEITYHYQEKKGSYIVHHYLKGTENSTNPTLLLFISMHRCK